MKLKQVMVVAAVFWCMTISVAGAHSGAGASPTVIATWNLQALDTVRAISATDAQAARLYAMMNVAMYDAVNGIKSAHRGSAHSSALVSPDGAPSRGDAVAAAAAAAHAVLAGVYPARTPIYDAELARAGGVDGNPAMAAGKAWGASVGARVLAARANDGSVPDAAQPASSGPGAFRASWSGVQFRNLAPFAIVNPSQYVSYGPPDLASVDYAAAFAEVKILGNAALSAPDKLATFQYWSLGSGTSQPPGAWLQVALTVTAARPQTLPDMARLFALLSMAMVDTVGPTYQTKYVYEFWRPTTAIREADGAEGALVGPDAGWRARAGAVGGSPEHWSGHSSFSAAAAATLAGFFCNDDIPFTLVTDSAGGQPRTYASFSQAATEAGRSRVFGGLHFQFSNQAGLTAGRAIAAEILSNKLLETKGPTHFGACPL